MHMRSHDRVSAQRAEEHTPTSLFKYRVLIESLHIELKSISIHMMRKELAESVGWSVDRHEAPIWWSDTERRYVEEEVVKEKGLFKAIYFKSTYIGASVEEGQWSRVYVQCLRTLLGSTYIA